MKRIAVTLLLSLLAVPFARASHAQSTPVAFVGADVIPMDSERILRAQTVVVRDGRIVALGPVGSTAIPADAQRIDARGKFLLPGLAEMHGHIPWQQAAFAEDVLFLYVANGALTVRGMQGNAAHFELRRRVNAGEIVGPRLVLSSPPISGNNAPDAATAERLVREHHAAGYDLLKVHEAIPAPAYLALARTARTLRIPFGGHVSDLVGLRTAFAEQQTTIDHLDNFLDELVPSPAALPAGGYERQRQIALTAEEARIPELVRAARAAGTAVVPTQVLWEVLRGAHDVDAMQARPELRYMPTQTVAGWVNSVRTIRAGADPAAAAREVQLRNKLLLELHRAGVDILMGTDAPQIFSVPGFSLHRELERMVEIGMTPYEVLRTGTVNVAKHFGWEDRAGTVAVGRNADLLLLEANPLRDIRALQQRAGVMSAGRWIPESEIRARLESIAARYAARD